MKTVFLLPAVLLAAVLLILPPPAAAQAPYWSPEPGPTAYQPPYPGRTSGAGRPMMIEPGMEMQPGMEMMMEPGMPSPMTAPTRGPIVARPFTIEPPKILIGERIKEKDVDLEWVDVEAVTGADIQSDELVPRVNTLEEYRKVLSDQEPAIYFDGQVFVYDKTANTYRPRDWYVQEANDAVWQEIQWRRQLAIQAYQQQVYRQMESYYRSRQSQSYGPGFRPGYGTAPTTAYGPGGPGTAYGPSTGYPGGPGTAYGPSTGYPGGPGTAYGPGAGPVYPAPAR